MTSILIRDLNTKWQVLKTSGLRPDIKIQDDLADALGLSSKSSISNWLNGSGGVKDVHYVPEKHVDALLDLYGLELYGLDRKKFVNASGEEFSAFLANRELFWEGLFHLAQDAYGAILMERTSMMGISETRGVNLDDAENHYEGERFALGERFRLRVQGPTSWWVAVLLRDPDGIHCVYPTETLTNEPIAQRDQGLCLPNIEGKSFRISRPEGQHDWLALVSAEPLPPLFYQGLISPLPSYRSAMLGKLTDHLRTQNSRDWRLLHKAFYVDLDL